MPELVAAVSQKHVCADFSLGNDTIIYRYTSVGILALEKFIHFESHFYKYFFFFSIKS